jgi:hypothetical protein
VHRDVEAGVHARAANEDFVLLALDRLRELSMLVQDEDPPLVGIRRIEKSEVDVVERPATRRTGKAPPALRVGDPDRSSLPLPPCDAAQLSTLV